jgi:HlyD family secretion protein
MKGKWLLLGGSAILLAIAAGALVWWKGQQSPPAPVAAKADPGPDPAKTAPQFFGNEVSLSGMIQPQKVIGVAPPIDGVIQEILVEPGSPVFQGQLLARIRNGKLENTLEAATAEVEKLKTRAANLEGSITSVRLESARAQADAVRAKADYERLEKAYNRQVLLYKEGATPRLTYEKSEHDYKQAQIEASNLADVAKSATERIDALTQELDGAKKLLDAKTGDLDSARQGVSSGELQSPVDGVVLSRKGQPGEAITRATGDFFQLAADALALQVAAEVEASVLPRIKAGQQAVVRAAEFPDDIPGVVKEVKGSTVLVDFMSPMQEIKPGLTARVKIKLQ